MTEPKLVYRYTHEQAVKDGDLSKLNFTGTNELPLYVSKRAREAFQAMDFPWGDREIIDEVVYVFLLETPARSRKIIGHRKSFLNNKFDLVWGLEIRTDPLLVPCLTVVVEGES